MRGQGTGATGRLSMCVLEMDLYCLLTKDIVHLQSWVWLCVLKTLKLRLETNA